MTRRTLNACLKKITNAQNDRELDAAERLARLADDNSIETAHMDIQRAVDDARTRLNPGRLVVQHW